MNDTCIYLIITDHTQHSSRYITSIST